MDTACAALATPGEGGRRRSSLHVVMAALAADEAAGDGGEGGEEPANPRTGGGDNEGKKKLAPPQPPQEDKGSSKAPSDTPAGKPAARAPLPPLRGRPPLGTLPKGCVAAAKRLQEQSKLLGAGPVYGHYDPPIYFSRGAVKSMNDAAVTPHAAKPAAAARLQPQPPTQPASPKRSSPVPAADTRQRFAALLGSVHKFHTKKAQPAEGALKRREASLKAKPRRVQHKAEWGSHTGPASQTKQLLAVEPRYVAAKALAELKQMNATDVPRSLRPLPPPQARKLPSQRQRASPGKEQKSDACIVLPPVRRTHAGGSPCASDDSRRAAAAAGAQPRPMRPSPSSPSSASEASGRGSSVAPRRSAGKGGAKSTSPASDVSSSYCEQPAPLASPVSTAATRSTAASPSPSPSPAPHSVKSPAVLSSAPASPAPPSPSSTCTSGRSIPDTLEGSAATGTPAHPPAQQAPAAASAAPPPAAQASVGVDDGSASEATTTCTPLPKDDAESSRSSSLSGSSRSASRGRDAQSPPPQAAEAAGYSSGMKFRLMATRRRLSHPLHSSSLSPTQMTVATLTAGEATHQALAAISMVVPVVESAAFNARHALYNMFWPCSSAL